MRRERVMREKWWGRSWHYVSDTNCPAKVKVNIIRRESWSEFNTKCNPVTWSFLFQNLKPALRWVASLLNCSCPCSLSKPIAPLASPPHDGSSYFSLLIPLISYKIQESHFPHSCYLVPLAQPCEALAQHCHLSATSISEHKPRIPKCHCCYICMGLSDCCTSVHMCLFSKSTTNVELNTLDCSTEQPCLLHVAKQT